MSKNRRIPAINGSYRERGIADQSVSCLMRLLGRLGVLARRFVA